MSDSKWRQGLNIGDGNLEEEMKRDSIIEKQIARYLMQTPNAFHTLLPFYSTRKTNPFLNLMISANDDKSWPILVSLQQREGRRIKT